MTKTRRNKKSNKKKQKTYSKNDYNSGWYVNICMGPIYGIIYIRCLLITLLNHQNKIK